MHECEPEDAVFLNAALDKWQMWLADTVHQHTGPILWVFPLLPRPLCSDGAFNGTCRGGTFVPATSPTGRGSASLREWPLIYGKCGSNFLGDLQCFTQHLFQAAQRPDNPLNTLPARTRVRYLSFVHSCADHRPVLLALLTIVFTVKLGDKLTLCYRALKTWRAVYTRRSGGGVCMHASAAVCVFRTAVCLLNSNRRAHVLHHAFICLCHQLHSTHMHVNTPTHPRCVTQTHTY